MKRSVGALLSCASSTSLTTRAMVLSAAAAVTRTRSTASPLIVPAKTLSSTPLRTGVLSPVTGASSMALSPAMITPSAGIRSPGRTRMIGADGKAFGRHLPRRAVLFEQRGLRHQRGQRPGCWRAPAGGDAFQQLADEEQEHDGRRFLAGADDDGADGGDGHQHLDRERRAGERGHERRAARSAPGRPAWRR